MKLQVLPLTVLATREVVRNRMDYFTFVNGTTKDELDKLDKLEFELLKNRGAYQWIPGQLFHCDDFIRDTTTLEKKGNLIYGMSCGAFPTRISRSQKSCGPSDNRKFP